MPRKRRSARERERLFDHHKRTCYLCKMPIKIGEAWHLEHLIPWELSRDESDANVRPAHVACHKEKTATDIRVIRKVERMRQKHLGCRPPSKFRNSKYRRKFDGTVEARDA